VITLIPWTQREFNFDQPLGIFPAIVERLRGTPVRPLEIIAGVSEEVLSRRFNGKWAGKEHLGHLADLDALDHARLKEFLNGSAIMSPADMRNRATEEARHRDKPVGEILLPMRTGRLALVSKLEQLTDKQVAQTMLHPRLQKQMRLVDWVWFIAEHDDHHLAHTRRCILQQIGR
jgi:DinB superfamily